MSTFDKAYKQYEDEAKEKWGNTAAYKESKVKTADYSKDKWKEVLDGMNGIFAEFADCKKRGESATGDTAQSLVKRLQNYITANLYNCTNEILQGLGQMYICDERFKNNIDKSGEGTAEFAAAAIGVYCK